MVIRKFKYEDLDEVARIAATSLQEEYTIDFFLYLWQINPNGFLVAEKNGRIAGFIVAVQPSLNELRILMLAVDKEFRRQKIGSTLLRELLFRFPDTRRVYLEVRIDNKEAIKFYEKNGFVIKKKINDFYTDGSPAYLMEKILF
jgi:ribosomal-protein-alanine N-acetyltransferase